MEGEGLNVLGRSWPPRNREKRVLIVCDDLARPAWLPLLRRCRRRRRRRRGARSCRRFGVICVFVCLWLGVLGGTTAFALGRGIYAFILGLSLGGPASLPLGSLLACRLGGRSAGLLVLRALGATSATLRGGFCGGSGVGGRVDRGALGVSIVCGFARGRTRHWKRIAGLGGGTGRR